MNLVAAFPAARMKPITQGLCYFPTSAQTGVQPGNERVKKKFC